MQKEIYLINRIRLAGGGEAVPDELRFKLNMYLLISAEHLIANDDCKFSQQSTGLRAFTL